MSTDSDTIRASLVEPSAFDGVWRRHSAAVYRYAAKRIDAAGAEEVLSTTFLVAFRKRARFDLERPDALPWLLGIATREIHRHRRAEARTLDAVGRAAVAEAYESTPDLDARTDARAELRRLGSVLRSMPERDRDVLLLYAWAGLDYAAIADALRIPVGTVRSRLNRARRTIRSARTPTASDSEGDTHGRARIAPHRA